MRFKLQNSKYISADFQPGLLIKLFIYMYKNRPIPRSSTLKGQSFSKEGNFKAV